MRPLLSAALVLLPMSALAQSAADAPAEAAPAEAAPAGPASYRLDSGKSAFRVRTYKGGVASGVAHNHAIAATQMSGSMTWDAAAGACTIEVTVDVPSLRVDAEGDRKALGLEGTVDEDQRKEIKGNMLAPDQLNGGAHKSMSFKSTSCSDSKVSGTLTIRGKSKTVSFTPKLDTTNGFKLSGGFDFKHTDFGFEGYSAMLGAIRNEDRLTLRFTAVGG